MLDWHDRHFSQSFLLHMYQIYLKYRDAQSKTEQLNTQCILLHVKTHRNPCFQRHEILIFFIDNIVISVCLHCPCLKQFRFGKPSYIEKVKIWNTSQQLQCYNVEIVQAYECDLCNREQWGNPRFNTMFRLYKCMNVIFVTENSGGIPGSIQCQVMIEECYCCTCREIIGYRYWCGSLANLLIMMKCFQKVMI